MRKVISLLVLALVTVVLVGQALAIDPGLTVDPDYYDDFSDEESGWGELSGAGYARGYVDGEYRIWVEAQGQEWSVLSGGPLVEGDFQAEVRARQSTASGSKAYALLFRAEDETHAYRFAVSSGLGQYSVIRFDGGEDFTTLIKWASSPAINSGSVTNTLGVDCQGARISVYVNDQLLATVSDTTYSTGYVGLDAANFEDPAGIEAFFDDLKVYGTIVTPEPTATTGATSTPTNTPEPTSTVPSATPTGPTPTPTVTTTPTVTRTPFEGDLVFLPLVASDWGKWGWLAAPAGDGGPSSAR